MVLLPDEVWKNNMIKVNSILTSFDGWIVEELWNNKDTVRVKELLSKGSSEAYPFNS